MTKKRKPKFRRKQNVIVVHPSFTDKPALVRLGYIKHIYTPKAFAKKAYRERGFYNDNDEWWKGEEKRVYDCYKYYDYVYGVEYTDGKHFAKFQWLTEKDIQAKTEMVDTLYGL